MLSLRRPSEAAIVSYLDRCAALPLSYAPTGMTRSHAAGGFRIDRERVLLGRGEAAFRRAARAIAQWQMFPRRMAGLYFRDAERGEGAVVGVLFRAGPLWSLNPCRVIYSLDEHGPSERSGFAYGTLPGHVARGEERFMVEWMRDTDEVWYELLAMSRPASVLAWLGYPMMRFEQRRFRRLSGQAMLAAVQRDSPGD